MSTTKVRLITGIVAAGLLCMTGACSSSGGSAATSQSSPSGTSGGGASTGTSLGSSPGSSESTESGSGQSSVSGSAQSSSPTAEDFRRFAGETLTIAGYSSTWNNTWQKGFGKYFTDLTGIKLQWIESSPAIDISKIKASAGAPGFDLMLMNIPNVMRAAELDAAQKIDASAIPNLAAVDQSLQSPYGVPVSTLEYGSCYNTKKFSELGLPAPTEASAWFAPALQGHIMLPSATATQWMMGAPVFARAFGFGYQDPQPTVDKLAELKPYGFFNASGDVDAAMTNGDVWLTLSNNKGRCLLLKKQGVPVDWAGWKLTVDGSQYSAVASTTYFVVPKGVSGKNLEMANLLMNVYLSDGAASATTPIWIFDTATPPLPAQQAALKSADPTSSDYIITDQTKLFSIDYENFLKYLSAWLSAWPGVLSK